MIKVLSFSDMRLAHFHNTIGLVYRLSRGLKVFAFNSRPSGKPIGLVHLAKGMTISESIIKANADLMAGTLVDIKGIVIRQDINH